MRLLFIFILFGEFVFSQELTKKTLLTEGSLQDTIVVDSGKKDSVKIFIPTINDYQFHTEYAEKSVLDTVLTYNKTYVFSQYNNKDNFGRLSFANIGSGYNPLVFENDSKQNLKVLPTNKSYGILGEKDVKYYNVKTPTTLFVFHNGMNEGVTLNTTYTQNIGKQFNFALEYMGLRSKGNYANSLAVNNNTLFSAHYISPNTKYEFFTHYLHQNVNNEENGGIVNDELFINGDDSSQNRQNMAVNLSGVNSKYSSRRYYFSHQFSLFKSEKFPFKVRHTIFHQGNKYRFNQTSLQSYFADNITSTSNDILEGYPLDATKFDNNLSNTFSIVFDDDKIKFDAGLLYQIKSLGVTQNSIEENQTLPDKFKENRIGIVGNLEMNLWEKVKLNSFLEYSNGSQWGSYLNSRNHFSLHVLKDYALRGKVNFQTAVPSFNYLLNGSVYKKYNFNWTGYKNQSILEVGGELDLKWFDSKIFANYFRIDNFTYLDENSLPQQTAKGVNISQIGGDAIFSYGKFHLNAKLLFQKTLTNEQLFPTPDVVGRFNLYYQSKAFKKAAEIQTGIKATYFTKFASRNFSPIFNEYTLQGNSSNFQIGNKPLIDAYFNLKVKRMFLFLEGQNLWSLTSNNKSYTAPHHPYTDFRLNIGLVWYMIH